MSLNPYFKQYTHAPNQKVVEDLIVQAIKIHGITVKYLPKRLINRDSMYLDDPLSMFEHAVEVEVYINDFGGYQGDSDFLSKFRMETRDQVNLVISKRRFGQILTEKLIMENGWNLQNESANSWQMGDSQGFVLEDGTREGYTIDRITPDEGDLVYIGLFDNIFEIRSVDFFKTHFYPFAKLMTYDLKCELYEYSSERIQTLDPQVNKLEDRFTTDILVDQIYLENNGLLQLENGATLVGNFTVVEQTDKQDQNDVIQDIANEFTVFDERNPFSKDFTW